MRSSATAPACSCPATTQLEEAFLSLMSDPVRRARLGAAARALVEANRGANEKSLTVLAALLPQEPRAYPANVRPFRPLA